MPNVAISSFTVPANTVGVGLSGYSLTGANAQSMFDLSGTWNTTGTPTALKLNITDTASNASSLLMDLQKGGVSQFSVSKSGAAQAINFQVSSEGLIRASTAGGSAGVCVGRTTNDTAFIGSYASLISAVVAGSGGVLGIAAGNQVGQSADPLSSSGVYLYRDAANTLAQRNATNAQTFRLYNTFTDASNYERATIAWDTNVCYFAYENAGTGDPNRPLRFGARGATNWFEYSVNNGLNATWSSSGNFSRTRWLNGNIQFDVGTVTSFLGLNTSGTSRLTLADAVNIEVNTATGTKIGTATSQKLGFWNATPIVQPTTAVAAATVAATGVGDVVAASTTFDGYTIPQIVKALRNAGLLA